jgi:hypothetical protein
MHVALRRTDGSTLFDVLSSRTNVRQIQLVPQNQRTYVKTGRVDRIGHHRIVVGDPKARLGGADHAEISAGDGSGAWPSGSPQEIPSARVMPSDQLMSRLSPARQQPHTGRSTGTGKAHVPLAIKPPDERRIVVAPDGAGRLFFLRAILYVRRHPCWGAACHDLPCCR